MLLQCGERFFLERHWILIQRQTRGGVNLSVFVRLVLSVLSLFLFLGFVLGLLGGGSLLFFLSFLLLHLLEDTHRWDVVHCTVLYQRLAGTAAAVSVSMRLVSTSRA